MLRSIVLCLVALLPATADAWDLLIDIDTDGDPRTVATATAAASAELRLILAPSAGPEWIAAIGFGLGGTCWECFEQGVPFTYGTETGLFGDFGAWHESPLFATSWGDASLCLGCCGGAGDGEGYHFIFGAEAAGGGFWLSEPVFIAGFRAWVSDSHVFARCPRPPADLISFPLLTEGAGNRVLLGGSDPPPTPSAARSWSAVKALY